MQGYDDRVCMEVCREETVVDTPFSDSLDDPEENKVIYITEGIKNKVPECSILIYFPIVSPSFVQILRKFGKMKFKKKLQES